MKRPKRILTLVLALFMTIACSGCMSGSVEKLYSLPQMSEEYVQLQDLIGQRIAGGGAYAAPTGGSNRQSIQLRDLDGDGTAEALAFLSDEDGTPTVCVYRLNEDDDYYLYVIIRGYGSAVAGVDYADLNGDGSLELIVAWRGDGDLRLLSVHALGGTAHAEQKELFSVDCSEFLVCDLNGDGVDDLLDLCLTSGGGNLFLYTVDENGLVQSSSAQLSAGVTGVRRAFAGSLADGTPALYVESDMDGGLVTDVFAAPDSAVKNLTMTMLGYSNTLRPSGVYATDVNGDRAVELPAGAGDILAWFSLNSAGELTPAATTYYNIPDGWYLILSGPLRQGLTVDRYGTDNEEVSAVFTLAGDDSAPQRSVLVIYTITGENRLDRGTADGRFILQEEESTVYAAQILTDELTAQDIIDNFHLIYAEWQSGDL